MPTHTEPWVAAQGLYATVNVSAVTTLATGGIYRGKAIAGAATPYVVMRRVPGTGFVKVVGAIRIWSDELWDMVAVGTQLQWETVDQIAATMDGLLDRVGGITTSNGVLWEITNERPINFDEEDEGVNYVYAGATYLVKAIATS